MSMSAAVEVARRTLAAGAAGAAPLRRCAGEGVRAGKDALEEVRGESRGEVRGVGAGPRVGAVDGLLAAAMDRAGVGTNDKAKDVVTCTLPVLFCMNFRFFSINVFTSCRFISIAICSIWAVLSCRRRGSCCWADGEDERAPLAPGEVRRPPLLARGLRPSAPPAGTSASAMELPLSISSWVAQSQAPRGGSGE